MDEGTKDLLITVAVIVVAIWAILSAMGIKVNELILGMRSTKRARVDDEPRDQAERWLANHRKVAKDSRPAPLRHLWLTGDGDVPPIKIGRIIGLEAHQEGYLVYARTSTLSWSKPYILIRELCSDVNRTNLFVRARGFSTNGLYRFAISPVTSKVEPSEAVNKAHNLFATLFGLQMLTDAEEDGAWATATAIMPAMKDRISKAEAEIPNLSERPYVAEKDVIR